MSSFTEALVYQSTQIFTDGYTRRVYKLVGGFRYWVGEIGSSLYVDLLQDFQTDLASIPKPLTWLITTDGPWAQAAVLHDYLYQENYVSRKMCDLIFLEALHLPVTMTHDVGILGTETRRYYIPRWRIYLMYWGVRIGGWVPYNRYKSQKKEATNAA